MRPAPEAEIPARFQRADEVLAGKLWREQLREWDDEVKPAGKRAMSGADWARGLRLGESERLPS